MTAGSVEDAAKLKEIIGKLTAQEIVWAMEHHDWFARLLPDDGDQDAPLADVIPLRPA